MIVYISFALLLITLFNINKLKRIYQLYSIFKNTVDPQNEKNCCTIFYDICKVGYSLFNLPKNPEKFKKHIKVPYEYRENKYVFLLKVPKGVMPVDFIKDENDNDISDELLPYLGPNLDCHGTEVFPSDFGLKKVIIKDINEKEYIFEEHQQINLKKEI